MKLPTIEFQVRGWEIKDMVEKDEEYQPILVDGKPIITDTWVILYVAIGEKEFPIEMEYKEFKELVFPKVFEPLFQIWKAVTPDSPLFSRREITLDWLAAEKLRHCTGD